MPFFDDEIGYLRGLKQAREVTQRIASDPMSQGMAQRIKALGLDYPWLSPGVALSLAKGGYEPEQAKQIALEDLRAQYDENPAKFGDFQDNHPRKRLKAWVKEFDAYLDAEDNQGSSSAFDPTVMQRGLQFQGITSDEIRQLRKTARQALDSGDGAVMTAALGVIAKRQTGQEDPWTIRNSTGLTPQAEWVGKNVADPIIDTGTAVAQPVVRTGALAANALYEGMQGALRSAFTAWDANRQATNSSARAFSGDDPESATRRAMGRDAQGWQSLAQAYDEHGVLAPAVVLGSQSQAGQAIDSLLKGEPVDVGAGYLPDPDSQTGQEAAAASRRYSPYLINGHAWTPGRMVAADVFSPDSTAFNVLSGLVDATVAMQADPSAVLLSGLGSAARASRTFENVDDAARLVGEIEDGDNLTKVTKLLEAGGVDGRRPLIRGKNPVYWLYGDGAPVVTKITEEADPWTIWNATGRKFSPELTAQLADSTDAGVTRQILAGELGTTIDRVPKYRDGLGLKPRVLTDMPSGVLDLNDTENAAHLIDQYLVLAKADEATRQRVFNNLVRSSGRGDNYAVADAVFDAMRESMVAAGAPVDKATEATTFIRQAWDDAQQWGVDAATGDELPMMGRTADGELVQFPAGPRWSSERLGSKIDMPDPRAIKRLVASPAFNRAVNSDGWGAAVWLSDAGYGLWKTSKLLRPAWTVKVVGDEQLRIMATGNVSVLNHPLTAIAIALGNPDEGRFFGKSWYERLSGFGKDVDPAEVDRLTEARAARARELYDADPFITNQDVLKQLNEELPVPKKWGAKASAKLREGKTKVGKAKTDVTGAPWDATDLYGQGLTNRFSDIKGGKDIYLRHFDVVDRTSEHWPRAVAEEIGRMSSEPAIRRALRLTPDEFKTELWEEGWGKYLRKQMAAGRDPGDPYLRVLTDRGASDAYGDAIYDQIRNFVGDDEDLRVALVTGKLGDVTLNDDWGHATQEGIDALKRYQLEGIGPDNVKAQRTLTKTLTEREKDLGKARSAVNAMFDALMTRPSNYLSRHPMFVQTYWDEAPQLVPAMGPDARAALAKNLDDANLPKDLEQRVRQALYRATGTEGLSLEDADHILKRRALNATRDTLYDLSKKSNMMDSLRFVFPFGEAFKEILTVWSRLALDYPQSLRRAQQGIQGAREAVFNPLTGLPTGTEDPMGAGFFRHDPQTGQEVFTIPLSGQLTKIAFGVPVPLKGSVQGLNMVGSLSPGVGPLLSIPASYLIPDKPGWDRVRDLVFPFGQPDNNSGGETIGNEVLPTWAKHLSRAFSDPRSDRLFSNTVTDMMAVLASTGEYDISGSPDSHAELNRLMHDAKDKAKDLYIIRALASATSPSAPGFDFYVKENPDNPDLVLLQKLRDEYRKMTDKHGYDEGFVRFVRKFGVDNLLATGRKSTSNVAGLTTSQEQRDWARKNNDLVEAYPETWALLAPAGTGHSQTAYEAQLDSGQRDPQGGLTAAQKANAQLAEAIVNNVIERDMGGEADTANERAFLRNLKEKLAREYDGYNPDGFTAGTTESRIRELERAVEDPKVADTDLGKALSSYFDAREKGNALARERGYSEVGMMDADKAAHLREQLRDYAKKITKRYPQFKRAWDLVLEKELAD